MFKQYIIGGAIIIFNLNFLSAAANSRRPISLTTHKPSTLLLPPGFDSQVVPLQPMLYPYAVAPQGLPTKPTIRNIKPITTADWIPLAVNSKPELSSFPSLFSSTRPVPMLEERISHDSQYSSSPSSNNGPVFESIVYGTWKPDPPLQPVDILNDTKMQKQQQQYQQHRQHQQHIDRRIDGSIYNTSSGLVIDGKFYNKTINRQHGGFIGLIQQKPIKGNRHNIQRNDFDKSLSNSSSSEYKSKESMESNLEQMQRKLRKQGRQKIRPFGHTTEQTAIERSSAADVSTSTTTTTSTTIAPIVTKESFQHRKNVNIVNATDPKLVEVVEQINESAEIKYNHKQTSAHSIDMMMTVAHSNNNAHFKHDDNNDDDDDDDDDDDYSVKTGVAESQTTTIPSVTFNKDLQANNNADTEDDLENISATRRSWPTDFMNMPLTTTTDGITEHWNDLDSAGSANIEKVASDIPSELSALNIPPSLWPKLPGNITKLGTPYETKSSAEEPALCVPITVQEQNIMNLRELVFIERVFCFPMPPSTTLEYNSEEANQAFSTTTTIRSSKKAKVQNFNNFMDSNLNLRTVNNAKSSLRNSLFLINFILIISFRFIV